MHLSSQLPHEVTLDSLCRIMVEKSPFGIFVTDQHGRYVYVNAAGCRLTGRSLDELIGGKILDLVPEDWHDRCQAHFDAVRHTGAAAGEFVFLHRDGTRRWWSVDAVALGDDHFLGYKFDVTERHDVDGQLQREKSRLSRASDVAKVGWWEFDLKSGRVVASSQALAIYGLPRDEEVTITYVQTIPLPEYRAYLDAALADLIAGRRPYHVQYRIRRPGDGQVLDIRSLAEFDTERQVVFGTLQDITDIQQAETALRESEVRLRAIFDTARDFIFLKDRDLRYTHANPACEEFLRRPVAEIVGHQDTDIFPPEYVSEIQASDRQVLAGQPHRGVFERRLHDRTIYLETIKVPVRDDMGEVVGLCGVSRDITEVRQLEDQLRQAQKMEAVGRLAGGVAHDFNNLLTPILGFADLLLQTEAPDTPAARDLEAIVRAAEKARDLTAQLLAFGRKQVLDMKVLDLNQVIRENESMLRRLLRENIRLDLVLAEDLGAIRADASQLHNILINLAINAADAMPDGGVLKIETQDVNLDEQYVSTHPASLPGPHVMLAVSDDGCGMAPEIMSRIFEPFFTTKQVNEGTGLGLATVHGIVKQHQGSVQVYSEPGHGTQFKVYLPLVAEKPQPFALDDDPRHLRGEERILLVEDDDAVRNLATMALAKYGYEVVPVPTPDAALAWQADADRPCDLLLTDVVMPGMNGAQLHRALKEIWPEVPALYMSGYTSNVIAHHGILAEGLHFLQKPFMPADLAAKVREVFDG